MPRSCNGTALRVRGIKPYLRPGRAIKGAGGNGLSSQFGEKGSGAQHGTLPWLPLLLQQPEATFGWLLVTLPHKQGNTLKRAAVSKAKFPKTLGNASSGFRFLLSAAWPRHRVPLPRGPSDLGESRRGALGGQRGSRGLHTGPRFHVGSRLGLRSRLVVKSRIQQTKRCPPFATRSLHGLSSRLLAEGGCPGRFSCTARCPDALRSPTGRPSPSRSPSPSPSPSPAVATVAAASTAPQHPA